MSTPTTLNTYHVIWTSVSADHASVREQVQAANWAFDPSIQCAVFKDADGVAVFTIRTEFFVCAALVTQEG